MSRAPRQAGEQIAPVRARAGSWHFARRPPSWAGGGSRRAEVAPEILRRARCWSNLGRRSVASQSSLRARAERQAAEPARPASRPADRRAAPSSGPRGAPLEGRANKRVMSRPDEKGAPVNLLEWTFCGARQSGRPCCLRGAPASGRSQAAPQRAGWRRAPIRQAGRRGAATAKGGRPLAFARPGAWPRAIGAAIAAAIAAASLPTRLSDSGAASTGPAPSHLERLYVILAVASHLSRPD